MTVQKHESLTLLTGATGYVGGRLLPLLEQTQTRVRCLARNPDSLIGDISDATEVVQADLLDSSSLGPALDGVDTAYYFVHSMGTHGDFTTQDRDAAVNFADAAKTAGVKRIVYLGGLGNPDQDLSAHLRSRQEIGDILRTSGAEVVEFRASIIIGSGSLSFELVRALVERLPVMICPKWVKVKAQPIAIEDVLQYLLAANSLPPRESRILEIGGPDQVSYGEIMHEYARQRGLRRWMIPVPFLTPYLSSLWLGLITPVYARVGRKLVESLRNPTLISNNLAATVFDIRPRGMKAAIARALVNEDREFAETRWSDAISSGSSVRTYGGVRFGTRMIDSRTKRISALPVDAFKPIESIGGHQGWYCGNWLWKLRGWMDLLVGGVGIRRGRRDPEELRTGDAVDFWRVESIEKNRLL